MWSDERPDGAALCAKAALLGGAGVACKIPLLTEEYISSDWKG